MIKQGLNMSFKEDIYNLKLHEQTVVIDAWGYVVTTLRVPGGWVYTSINKGSGIGTSVFVPFNNEFQPEVGGTLTKEITMHGTCKHEFTVGPDSFDRPFCRKCLTENK
jgi:hypothetical protein